MTPTTNNLTVSPKELYKELCKAMKAKLPVLITGAPGIGKTDIVTQVAKELKMDLVVMHPVVCDPTDFKGLPGIVNGKAEFLPYGDLRKLMDAKKPTICFIDDVGQAPQSVQAALMQLLLARQVNGKKISKHVVFVAATNRRQDRAGVTAILEPVKSRFVAIIELAVNTDDWIEWAIENEIAPEVIAFIHFRPELLCSGTATAEIINHPCPRTWWGVSELIEADITSIAWIAGAIGEAAAGEFVGFLKIYTELPEIEDIIHQPKTTKVPIILAAKYAVVIALATMANRKNIEAILTYGKRMSNEFDVLLGLQAAKQCPDIKETNAYIAWCVRHPEISASN